MVKYEPAMTDLVFSLVILAAILLLVGAFVYWRRTGAVKQPVLMVVLAIVAVANVLLLTIPTTGGTAPIDQIEAAEAQ
jgi:membrane-associated PAP2 superfamily phosphatase